MSFTSLNAQEFKQMCSSDDSILIDVREPAEYRSGSIVGAHSIPLGSIELNKLEESAVQNIKNILIFCQKGVRGEKACKKLLAENPDLNLFNLNGGIESWRKSNFETSVSHSSILPLDRQVQITIGSFVLLGALLSQFQHPNFIWLSGFFGAGLLFAGLSGFCGLARVIAKMPWNQ